MQPMHDASDPPDAAEAIGYISYADGEPTDAETLEDLAAAAAAAVDAGAETHWLRARTAGGDERQLTVDEQKAVLVAMQEVPRAD